MCITEEQRSKHGFFLCSFPSDGEACGECGRDKAGDPLYFTLEGSRARTIRCMSCTDALIRRCERETCWPTSPWLLCPVPWWKVWDPRSGILGGVVTGSALFAVLLFILITMGWLS